MLDRGRGQRGKLREWSAWGGGGGGGGRGGGGGGGGGGGRGGGKVVREKMEQESMTL